MAAILIVAGGLTTALPAVACSGGKLIGGHEAAYARRVEFTGTVVRRDDPNGSAMTSSADLIRWTFVVDAVTRGEVGERFTVTSARSSTSCGEEFVLGNRYSIIAWGGDDPVNPDVGPGDARQLQPLANPPPVEGSHTDLTLLGLFTFPLTNPVGGAVLLGVLTAGWWMLRARRPEVSPERARPPR